MKKLLTLLVVLAMAGVASAETIWGVTDDWNGGSDSQICAFESTDGTAVVAPVSLDSITGGTSAWAYGIAVAGNICWVSVGADGIVTIDLNTMSLLGTTATADRMRGLSWDGTTLWGAGRDTDTLYAIQLGGNGVPTGTLTAGAAIGGNHDYFSSLANPRPSDGVVWALAENQEELRYTSTPGSGTMTDWGDKTNIDVGGAIMWTTEAPASLGEYMLFSKVSAYNIYTVDVAAGKWGAVTSRYDPYLVNSWTPTAFGGFYGLSPVGPPIPEPATLSLLALGGLLAIRRRK